MKVALWVVGAVGLVAAGAANAACYGTGAYKTCTDDSGNSYSVQEYGNTTAVQGSNAETGNTWSQTTQRIGDSSYTTGSDADGNTWTQNSRKIGDTVYQSGQDSDGNSFNGTIRKSGNTTTYSGTDSDGNSYYKTCTEYGCY